MRPRSLLAHLLLVLSLSMGVSAQMQMAQCLLEWEWNRNSLDQDPCTVGSMLDASCRGQIDYIYQKLEKPEYYVPPSKDHAGDMECDCNTVIYSLVMACATCQEGAVYGWPGWTAACETVYITQYPGDIPQGTAVPQWAFYNVTLLSGGKYDDDNAKNIGRDPEATPKQLSTPTKSEGPDATGFIDDKSPSEGSKTAAIVGGVVGGVGALILIPIIVYFVVRCSRRNKDKGSPLQYQETPIVHWKILPTSVTYDPSASTGSTVRSNIPFQPYDPGNPSTFPPHMPGGQTNQFPNQPAVTYVTPYSNYGARR